MPEVGSRMGLINGSSTNFLSSTPASSSAPTVPITSTISNSSCQQQMTANFLNDNLQLTKIGVIDSQKLTNNGTVNWSNGAHENNNNNHSNSNNNNNNAGGHHATTNKSMCNVNDNNTNNSVIDSETYLLNYKGSENVKRFSVNNLLQLANCRAVTNIDRAATSANGKFQKNSL